MFIIYYPEKLFESQCKKTEDEYGRKYQFIHLPQKELFDFLDRIEPLPRGIEYTVTDGDDKKIIRLRKNNKVITDPKEIQRAVKNI